MLLSEIIKSYVSNLNITGIQSDSRLVKDGNVFFAIDGRNVKGISFAEQAIDNGAIAVVCSNSEFYTSDRAEVIKTSDIMSALGEALNNFYKTKPNHIIGITGTSGKTSVAEFTRQIIEMLNYKSASIGSLGVKYGKEYEKNDTLTMKELVDAHQKLNFLKSEKGVDYAVMEFTSQGMHQRRGEGLDIEIGVFNNITAEHLDYHRNMEEYFKQKMLLFTSILKRNSKVVLNADIPEYKRIKDICEKQEHIILSYGVNSNSDIFIYSIDNFFDGQIVKFKYKEKEYTFKTNLIGKFQIMNLFATLGIIIQLNIENDIDKILKFLSKVKQADGRLEFAGKKKNGALIYIDYAHKPDALEKVLMSMREHIGKDKEARIGVLFGCGGDRDKIKRPIMGKIAEKLADFVFVTDDNCRTENPDVIRSEIMAGCPNAFNIGDRKIAIKKAIELLKPKDILILAGKGHEKYNIIGKEILPFDEFKIVDELIKVE
ncbi:MAG: UDP-N-acetylmuramoyl-L-alanyl-D-glutamate--2,6-diaminopimelate ligase [Rickettsiales bacterium]|jgi:UDP-N-acetylmuramoyl-L-alanyl-D-glutamate--2,6-diaminopimelate ligase|nr:UDP-N-acetylmuramoyl-L-alanyl-D-glutamate--2,6-diaminopimelate ligase [Rickettsiales bacterium]